MNNTGPHSSIGVLGGHAAKLAADRRAPEFGYRAIQVCDIVGITYRQLDYWARTELVVPSLAVAHGSGSSRRFSRRDLIELAIIKRLLDAGISLQSVRRAVTHLRHYADIDLADTNLVLAGLETILATSGDQITELLRSGHPVLNIVPLAGVVTDVDEAIGHRDQAGLARS